MNMVSLNKKLGFTIVELLVVIVVIGILAAITIVSYTGITNKATLASLTSDLDNASKQLKIFQTINGKYPDTISINCSSTPDDATNKCIKLSPGNTVTSLIDDYIVNNSTSPQTFNLTIKNSSTNIISVVTESSKPSVLVPAPLNPVADWIATPTGDHYGNYYDTVTKTYATVNRATTKTIYDPATQHIYDVPPNKLAVTPRSDGKSGSEAVIEEGRTNYVLNSSFEADGDSDGLADSWSSDDGTLVRSLDSSGKMYGSKSQKVIRGTGGGGASLYTYGISVTPNAQYTVSFWMKETSGSAPYRIYDYTAGAYVSYDTGDIVNGSVGSWRYHKRTFTIPSNGGLIKLIFDTTISTTFYIDAVQIEAGAFATSYIPTTVSAVTRNSDVVTVQSNGWDSNKGTFFVVAEPSTSGRYISWIGATTAHSLYRASGNQIQGVIGGTPTYTAAKVGTYVSTAAMTWVNGGSLYGYMDGSPSTATSGIATSPLNATVNIGGYAGYDYINGAMQRVIVYNTALSSADITTLANAVKNGP